MGKSETGISMTEALLKLAKGIPSHPPSARRCIIADIDIEIREGEVDHFAARLSGFRHFLNDFYLTRFDFVGVQKHCIRSFFQPQHYDAGVREKLREELDLDMFHDQMAMFDIDRLFVYGRTLVIDHS